MGKKDWKGTICICNVDCFPVEIVGFRWQWCIFNLVLIDIFSHHWDSESSAVCDVSEDTTYVGYESGNEQRESSLASSDFTNNEQLDGGNHTAAVQNRQGWKKRYYWFVLKKIVPVIT